jgi:hypothetical protein
MFYGERLPDSWITDSLPDSDVTVLLRVQDDEDPVCTGFHNGETWCSAEAGVMKHPVIGWMHLEDAVAVLDRHAMSSRSYFLQELLKSAGYHKTSQLGIPRVQVSKAGLELVSRVAKENNLRDWPHTRNVADYDALIRAVKEHLDHGRA